MKAIYKYVTIKQFQAISSNSGSLKFMSDLICHNMSYDFAEARNKFRVTKKHFQQSTSAVG